MIIRSAGFISPSLIRSTSAVSFAYALYLKLRAEGYPSHEIGRYVPRWFVLSVLTGRYSASPETTFDYDIRQLSDGNMPSFLASMEQAELSDAFWATALTRHLATSSASSPYFYVFLAAQVKMKDRGFLSRDITVADLISHRGDVHHIFPKDYLKKKGLAKSQYNQVANFAYMQSEINIKVGNVPPCKYLQAVKAQCEAGTTEYGGIDDTASLTANLRENCIPDNTFLMDVEHYGDFLEQRRILMARKMREYYQSL